MDYRDCQLGQVHKNGSYRDIAFQVDPFIARECGASSFFEAASSIPGLWR
jgi:hypothetical protein